MATVRADVGVWSTGGPLVEPIAALAIDPTMPATLYAGTSGHGVFKSTDGGLHWSAAGTGLPPGSVTALAIDPTSPATLYAGTLDGGVFKSSDAGGTWAAVNAGLETGSVFQSISALAIDPTMPASVYAGTWDGAGVFKSSDGGTHWTAVDTGLPGGAFRALALDPAVPTTLYAAQSPQRFYIEECGYQIPTPPCPDFGGVFRTSDGGGQWTAVTAGLPSGSVTALAIDPAATATVYAGTVSGVFRTDDGGAHWAAANAGLSGRSVTALAIDPAEHATIYAGTSDAGVFGSRDGGMSWSELGIGLTSVAVHALAVVRTTDTTIHAGTDAGVFELVPCSSARCSLDAALADPACAGERVPARVTGRLERGANLVDRATGMAPKRARRLLKRAKRLLTRANRTAIQAAKGKKPKIVADCAAALEGTIGQIEGRSGCEACSWQSSRPGHARTREPEQRSLARTTRGQVPPEHAGTR